MAVQGGKVHSMHGVHGEVHAVHGEVHGVHGVPAVHGTICLACRVKHMAGMAAHGTRGMVCMAAHGTW
jgi:hypothetical protein